MMPSSPHRSTMGRVERSNIPMIVCSDGGQVDGGPRESDQSRAAISAAISPPVRKGGFWDGSSLRKSVNNPNPSQPNPDAPPALDGVTMSFSEKLIPRQTQERPIRREVPRLHRMARETPARSRNR